MTAVEKQQKPKMISVLRAIRRYFLENFIQPAGGKKNVTFFSYRKNFIEKESFDITKIDKNRSLYSDRFFELRTFYNITRFQYLWHCLSNGTPNTHYYKSKMLLPFTGKGTDKENLKATYARAAFMYSNRLMLRYHKYNIGLKSIAILRELMASKEKSIRVLDYGCGVADSSLILALHGADVTIVDLDDEKFDFAKSRFRNRKVSCHAIGATETEGPVEVSGEFDVVIMSEFLEHVRSPRLFLAYALSHLRERGILYDSLGPVHKHSVGGDHLREAKSEMENTDYQGFFVQNLVPVNDYFNVKDYDHFYIKKGSGPHI